LPSVLGTKTAGASGGNYSPTQSVCYFITLGKIFKNNFLFCSTRIFLNSVSSFFRFHFSFLNHSSNDTFPNNTRHEPIHWTFCSPFAIFADQVGAIARRCSEGTWCFSLSGVPMGVGAESSRTGFIAGNCRHVGTSKCPHTSPFEIKLAKYASFADYTFILRILEILVTMSDSIISGIYLEQP
jgi:hypothetical protein